MSHKTSTAKSFTPTILAAVVGIISIGVVACGGGGGGGTSTTAGATATATGTATATTTGQYPRANPPTCAALVRQPNIQTEASIRAHISGNFRVPASSIESMSDVGRRAHTNYLVNTSRSLLDNTPSGYSPSQILTAYNIPANGGSGAVAVVEAFDYPQALSDFNIFSTEFGLPTETSSDVTSSSNRVLQVIYASGIKPTPDADWAQETALDAQWVHAVAPNTKIYVVEAASSSLDDLMAAVRIAEALPNVRQVSMSFGSSETGCNYVNYDSVFVKSGVTFFVAAGDSPGDLSFPPGSANVIAVGGTSLLLSPGGQRISETVWGDTQCGPSFYEPRPVFQDGIAQIVGLYRGACDIAAIADPENGVSVYDSFPIQGTSGWVVLGGTSAATPIIAGIANTAGVLRSNSQDQNTHFYAALGSSNFNDIVSGTASMHDAAVGWDYATGVGTPNGIGGF